MIKCYSDIVIVQRGSEKTLRDFFQPTLPAAAGELVSRLGLEEFSLRVPKSATVPGVVEIIRALLGKHIRQVTITITFNLPILINLSNSTICYALGCPKSYLDGFEGRISDSFKFLILNVDTPAKAMALWRSRPTPAWISHQKAASENTEGRNSPVASETTPYCSATHQRVLEASAEDGLEDDSRIVERGWY